MLGAMTGDAARLEAVRALMCAKIGAEIPDDQDGASEWARRVSAFDPVGDLRRGAAGWIDYLQVRPSGNFGNNYTQLLNALTLAEAIGARAVAHRFDWFRNGGPDRALKLTRRRRPPKGQAGLAATYFLRSNIARLKDAPPERMMRVSNEFLAPTFRLTPEKVAPICVNFRGGADVFDNPAPNGRYGQPPLSFYQLALSNIFERYGAAPVVVVHQDERNPALAPLLAWLREEGVAFQAVSGGPETDARAILGARHIVMGWTSFTAALALLSPNLTTVSVFRRVQLQELLALKADALFVAEDWAGDYFRAGGWRNNARQRRMMLDYPRAALELHDIARPAELEADADWGRKTRRAHRRRRFRARFGLARP